MLLNEKMPEKKQAEKLALRAEELFSQGFNCCESIIKATIESYNLNLPQDTYLMGSFFKRGVAESGCICGALAGGVMMLGYLAGKDKNNLDLAQRFREQFMEKFGTSCCRIIRNKQSFTARFRSKECKHITKFTAGKLQEIVEANFLAERLT